MQLLDKDEMDDLDGTDLAVASSEQADFKSSLEGLSEREVRILVQDEFTPITNKQAAFKNLPMQTNIHSGSGLANTTMSTSESPLKFHDGMIASIASNIPIAPTMSSITAEELIKQTKVAAASGDLFLTGKCLWE